jgi:C4-dicarboxylate-specific signal transduction histidine kinase
MGTAMQLGLYASTDIRSVVLAIVVAGLALAIFVVDTITDLELATAVLYVSVILLTSTFCGRRGVLLVSAGCILLTLSSFVFTRAGSPQTGVINGTVSLLTILITTYLILRIGSAQVATLEARAQLAHVARLTALGEMAASIAHEVNQPLTAVVTSGNACLRWLNADPPQLDRARSAVERMVSDANRASDVVGRVHRLAQPVQTKQERLGVNDIIREVVALTRTEIEKNQIVLRTHLADNLPPVVGDRIQLQQVLLNLIINALDSLNATEHGVRELDVSSAYDESTGVRVTVADTGKGLDSAKMGELFEPFHTTKATGMGIGLTISRSIIEGHGGRIWASSGVGRGAVFQFSLPAARANAQ